MAAALIASACGTGRGDVVAPTLITTTTMVPESSVVVESSSSVTTTMTPPPAEIEQVDCPEHLVDEDTACGVATVPIDRQDPGLGTTRVTVATMRGYDGSYGTPVAVLQGGPGGSSSELASWFPQQPFTQVFVDQRGTGFVGPDFDCPELTDVLGRALASNSAEAGVLTQQAVDDCARRLDQDPVLQSTDSNTHAADVADVMDALGYERWIVYGVSYGTTIGLEVMRDEPNGLVGVVLDGVYPPELDTETGLAESAQYVIGQVDEACRNAAICRGYVDGELFSEVLERVMGELDAEPMIVEVSGGQVGLESSVDVVLDGQRLAEFTFLMLYSESRLRYLPAVVGGLDDREESSARWLAAAGSQLVAASQAANDEGTYFAVQCHDRLPFTDGPGDDLGPFAAAVTAASLPDLCAQWERGPALSETDDPVTSDLPTLLLSGRFDPITPSPFAEGVATRLEAATVVEQDGRGHGIWYGSDCIARIVQSFVADPARVLDTSCAAEGVAVEWASP